MIRQGDTHAYGLHHVQRNGAVKNFSDLTEQELLALAIDLEEEDSRTYSDLAEAMRETYPGTVRMFAAMAEEENGHRHRLLAGEPRHHLHFRLLRCQPAESRRRAVL